MINSHPETSVVSKSKNVKQTEKAIREIERIKQIKLQQTEKKNLEEELKKMQLEKQISTA